MTNDDQAREATVPVLTPRATLLLAIGLLAAVCAADAVASWQVDLSAFYLLPIVVLGWGLGLGWGAAFALLVGSLEFAVNLDQPYPGLAYRVWNGWNNLLVYLVAALAVGLLRRRLERERQLNGRNAALALASQASARQLERLNRLYQALGGVNRAAAKSPTPEAMLDALCRVMVESGAFAMAWVGWEDPATGAVPVACAFGDPTGYLDRLQIRTDDGPLGRGPTGTAIREGQVQVNNDFMGSEATRPWQAAGRQAGLASSAAIPLFRESGRRGVLTVYAQERDFFGDREVDLLREVGETVCRALDHFEAEAGRRQAEARIDGERRHLLAIIDGMPDLVSLKTADGRYLDCNPGYQDLFGRPRAEILGRTSAEILGEGRDGDFGQLDAEVVRSRTGSRGQRWVAFAGDGRRRFLDIAKKPLLEADGSLYGILTVSRDITPLFESQTQLQEREAMLRRAQVIAKVGNWEFDPARRCFSGSEEAYRILGLPMVEPIREETFWDLVHPDDRARLREAWAAVAAGTPVESEYRILADGRETWLHSMVELDTDALGGAVRILGTIQDVTRTKRFEAQVQLQALALDQSLDTVTVCDLDGRIMYANEAQCRLVGRSRDELIGQPTEVYAADPAGREAQYNLVRDTLVCGSWRGELVQTAGDGTRIPMDLRTSLVRDPEGRPIAMIGVGTDVSERKLAETELHRANRRLRAMIGCNLAVIHAADESALLDEVCRIIVQVGGHRMAWFGRAERDPERTVRPLAQSGADPEFMEALRVTWADGERGRGPTGTAIRTGRPSYTRDARTDARFAPWRDLGDPYGLASALALPVWLGDQVFGALSIYSDTVEAFDTQEIQLLTELTNNLAYGIQALRARAELRKLSMAVEQSPESIVITDLAGTIEYVNPAFEQSSGYSRQEALGANPRILQSGKTPRRVFQDIWDKLVRGETWKGELTNRRKDGTEYVEFAILAPIRQPDGRMTHYLAVKDDITEKKQIGRELDNYRRHLEELVASRTAELAAATVRAQEANRAKSAFLANMSHEIRTPMNAILGLTHLLRREAGASGQSLQLEKISMAGQHLLGVIDGILDFSKIEAGHMSLDPHDFSVARVVQDAWALVAPKAEAKGLELVTDIAGLPAELHGDGLRLGQILLNLLANAVKFTERGRVVLRGAVLDQDPRTVRIRFEVEDTGIGLSPDQRERLFNAFTQADASTTRRHGGTGLGLVISRSFAELMGGRMGVDSEPGRGSRFWVEAPFGRAAEPPGPAATDRPAGTGGAPEAQAGPAFEAAVRHRIAGRTVLLAEDNELNQEVARELLHAVGLEVDSARDGLQAVRMAGSRSYDLILMDIQMPELDGLRATRRIRALSGHRDTPILAMTASAFAEDLEAARAAGMNDHVVKPVDPENLFRKLDQWLASRPSVDPAGGAPEPPPAAPAPPVPAVAGLADLLQAIPGLDLQRGLVAFRGDPAGLWRMLQRFAGQHRDDADRLREALAARDLELAIRLAHTLKGLAATFGLEGIHPAARAVELALRAGAGPLDLQEPLAALECGLAAACAAIGTGPAEDHPLAPAADPAIPPGQLAALRELLADDDPRAAKLFEQMLPSLRARFGTRIEPLAAEVRTFNFEQAVQALDTLLAAPGSPS